MRLLQIHTLCYVQEGGGKSRTSVMSPSQIRTLYASGLAFKTYISFQLRQGGGRTGIFLPDGVSFSFRLQQLPDSHLSFLIRYVLVTCYVFFDIGFSISVPHSMAMDIETITLFEGM